MKQIEEYSYQCGVMDCFSEMVKAGLKRIALSHPSSTKEIRDQYIPFAENICDKYQIHYYRYYGCQNNGGGGKDHRHPLRKP